jgi:putative ABC transport system ATP-binding protein
MADAIFPRNPAASGPTRAPLVELDGVVREYGIGSAIVWALQGITLTIGRGEVVCVVGPSGSGKSTLLHVIGCLDQPTAGALRIDGRRVDDLSDAQLSGLRRDRIGFVFQSFSLIPVLTAFENVEYPMILAGRSSAERRRTVRALLEEVGLGEHLHRYPNRLSGGQMQRVAIARALVNEPSLVLADEPTAHLDSATSAEILHLMRDATAQRGGTLVVATHDPEVLRIGHRIVRLQDGRVLSDAPAR